jgi:hypothetical protein
MRLLSAGHVRCTASYGRCTLARPASPVWNASVDVLRRTRLNADTIKGATPDSTIGRAAAVRAGARPSYHRMPVVSSDFLNPPTFPVQIRPL